MSTNRKPYLSYAFSQEMADLASAYLDQYPASSSERLCLISGQGLGVWGGVFPSSNICF